MGLTSSKPTAMSSLQLLPTSSMMSTPTRLTPEDHGTYEFLLQMGFTPQAVVQQMTQAPPTAALAAAPEGNQQPSTNGANAVETDEEEVKWPTPPAPPPAFGNGTPYNVISFGGSSLTALWKQYNPTGTFYMQGFAQWTNDNRIDLIEAANITRCYLRHRPACILSYRRLLDDPRVSVNSTQVHFPDELIRSTGKMMWDITGMNTTRTNGTTVEHQASNMGHTERTGHGGCTQCASHTGQGGRGPSGQRHKIPRVHTPPEHHNQTSA